MAMTAERVAELLPFLTSEEQAELDDLLNDGALWHPLPGPQSLAYNSQADITGYGGAAGGGKTDLACGLALTKHKRSIIYRRESAQLEAVLDRMSELVGSRDGLNSQKGIWRLTHGRQVEFGGFPHLGNEKRYQGRPHDLKVFDEVTEMLEAQVRFLMGWLRSSDPDVPQRVLMNMNPPTAAEGRWVIPFFGPWLDDKHPKPAREGDLRWFTTIDGKDEEVDDVRPFVMDGATMEDPQGNGRKVFDFDPDDYADERQVLIIRPLSRTFIFARVTDNPHYMASGYAARLQALPEPLRSQMLMGDFNAGVQDDPWQIIPTAWVDAAMARWRPRTRRGVMDSLGVDVARGGDDDTVLAPRHDLWFDELKVIPGIQTPTGQDVFAYTLQARRDQAPVHVDIIGWGASVYDQYVQNHIQAIGVNGSSKSAARSREGNLAFVNKRAELWWRMREALDPSGPEPVDLPPDPALKADLCAPKWFIAARGIQVEDKEEIKSRIGRSPDRGDAACLANMRTLRTSMVEDMEAGQAQGRSKVSGY